MSAVKLEGFEEFQARLKKNVKLEDVKVIVKYHGSEMQTTAKEVCPVDTGDLKGSITLEFIDNRFSFSSEVEPHQDYAEYVERGTRRMSAQPYMRPAFIQQSARFKDDLKKLMK